MVFLTTRGGDPNAGYRIGRCLRHSYPDGVKFCVPSYCKSAGTLIAICADELAIGNQGELGPLDIQVRKPSEFGESNSGLDPINALTVALEHGREAFRNTLVELRRYAKLSTKLAGEFASQIIAFGLWIDITDFEGRRQIDRVTKDQRVLFWKRR